MARQYGVKVYTIGIGGEKEIDEVVNSPLGHITQKENLNTTKTFCRTLRKQPRSIFQATDNEALKRFTTLTSWKNKNKR